MSDTREARTSFKLRDIQATTGQRRVARSLFEAQCRNLFLKTDEKSCLKAMRIKSTDRPYIDRTKSRSNTDTTLVPTTDTQSLKAHNESESHSDHHANAQETAWVCIERAEAVHNLLSESARLNAFIIPKENSWSQFSITKEVYEGLSSGIDVFPAFRDTIVYMGARHTEYEVLPPPPKWRSLQEDQGSQGDLSRECSYVLRYMQPNGRSGSRPWSLRQFAVYDKYMSAAEMSKWVFVSPPDDVVATFQDMVHRQDAFTLETNIGIHIMSIEYAVACFRPYLAHLSEQVAKHVSLRADPFFAS